MSGSSGQAPAMRRHLELPGQRLPPPGCVPFVHNEIIGAEIAGTQTSISLRPPGGIDWRGVVYSDKMAVRPKRSDDMKNGACTFRRRYLKVSTISCLAALLSFGEAAATPANMTVERLLTICEAPTVQEAMVNGDKLDWQRLSNTDVEEWRRSFAGYNGGSVDVVGWRHEVEGGAELLSFWIAAGPDGHKACAYTTPRPSGFLDALSDRLGAPDNLDKNDVMESVTAGWKRGAVDYSFVQVGTSAVINISSNR